MKLFKKPAKWFSARRNRVECIYGPPEMLEERRRGRKDPPRTKNPAEGIYGPPAWFDRRQPQDNTAEDVYGPPVVLGAIGSVPEEPDVTEEPDDTGDDENDA
jgi:hypothetical protein